MAEISEKMSGNSGNFGMEFRVEFQNFGTEFRAEF